MSSTLNSSTSPTFGRFIAVDTLGRPLRPESYSDAWPDHAEAAGLRRIVLHAGRHTAASSMADADVPIVVAAAWLGQSQISVTAAYQHALAEGMKAAGEKLGAALSGTDRS